MATKLFKKYIQKISQDNQGYLSLKATGVGYDELASVDGKLAQVVKIIGDEVTLQVSPERKVSVRMPRWYSWGRPLP